MFSLCELVCFESPFACLIVFTMCYICTDWSKVIAPKFIQCAMSTPFLGDRPWYFARVSIYPRRTVKDFFCFLSHQTFVLSYFFGYLGLKGYHSSGEKKKGSLDLLTVRQGQIKTCVQNFRVYLPKTAWTFGPLCGKRAKITTSHRNYLVSVLIRFFGVKYDLIVVLRSQFFEYMRETLYKHALEHLEAACSEKNGEPYFPPTKTPDHYWPLWRPVIGRDTFSALAPV